LRSQFLCSGGQSHGSASLSYLDVGFESHRGQGGLPFVNEVCWQFEFSTSDPSSGGVLRGVVCLSVITMLRKRRGDDWNIDRSARDRKDRKIINSLNVK
jgi:hypothetical protein